MKTKSKIFGSILVVAAMLFAGMEAVTAPQVAYARISNRRADSCPENGQTGS